MGFILFTGAFVGHAFVEYLTTSRARILTHKAFALYVGTRLADQTVRRPELLRLGGVTKRLACLFTDIEGFSTLSEHRPASEVSQFLNTYFTQAEAIVSGKHQGFISKYIGDAIFALFGEPIALASPQKSAVRAALELQNIRAVPVGGEIVPVHTRVGISFGDAVIGNLGSENRFDFTAVGDAVNVGQRLESTCKLLSLSLLMSDEIARAVQDEFQVIPIGAITVSGRSTPVQSWTVFPERMDNDRLQQWRLALQLFEKGEWERAKRSLELIVDGEPRLAVVAKAYLSIISTEAPSLNRPLMVKGQSSIG